MSIINFFYALAHHWLTSGTLPLTHAVTGHAKRSTWWRSALCHRVSCSATISAREPASECFSWWCQASGRHQRGVGHCRGAWARCLAREVCCWGPNTQNGAGNLKMHNFNQLNLSWGGIFIAMLYIRDGKPIYYLGPHKMWEIATGPQILINFPSKSTFNFPKKMERENYVKERERHLKLTVYQRWPRILSAGIDSGKILCFSYGPVSGPGVKNVWKIGPGTGVTFQFRQQQKSVWSFLRSLCGHFWSKTIGNFRLHRL